MLEYTLSKRFLAICMSMVLVLACALPVLAEDEPPASPPPASSEPDSTPEPSAEPEESPEPSPPPDPSDPPQTEMPPPSEPPQTEIPIPVATPESPQAPAPTATPEPTQTPQPTSAPEPVQSPVAEYSVETVLGYLEESGISFATMPESVPEIGVELDIPNFPGMHRMYLGRSNASALTAVSVFRYLPELYLRLTAANFFVVPVSCGVVAGNASGSSFGFTYNADTGILTVPFMPVQSGGNYAIDLFDIYCYYNDSVVEPLDTEVVTSRLQYSGAVGSDMEVPNFPGLHCLYLGLQRSNVFCRYDVSAYLPDMYGALTLDNLVFSPYGGYSVSAVGLNPAVAPTFSYDSSLGIFEVTSFGGLIGASASGGVYWYLNGDAYLIYNIETEMVLPDPSPSPMPDTPPSGETAAPHPFWTTPFTEYTVSEGVLLLAVTLMSLFGIYKLFK